MHDGSNGMVSGKDDPPLGSLMTMSYGSQNTYETPEIRAQWEIPDEQKRGKISER
jgi:hypothetical protein